jgi:hypothetical protein
LPVADSCISHTNAEQYSCTALGRQPKRLGGIGYEFRDTGGPYTTGIDFDYCFDTATGIVEPSTDEELALLPLPGLRLHHERPTPKLLFVSAGNTVVCAHCYTSPITFFKPPIYYE